jgi:glycosyltransferase involved in cell wall biosynthesis
MKPRPDRQHILVAAHHWYHDAIGGSFRLATQFAEYLAAQGHKVSYLCCAPPNSSFVTEVELCNGIDVWRYPYPQKASALSKLRYHVSESTRLLSAIASNSPIDSINGHSPLQFLGTRLSSIGKKIYSNYTVHSPFDDEFISQARSLSQRLKRFPSFLAAKWIERLNLQSASTVQTDSLYTLRRLKVKYPVTMRRKGIVRPGWVDTDRFIPVPNRQQAKELLGNLWTEKPFVFLTVRRLEQRMGLDTLIQAATLLRQKRCDFRVIIGGGGPLRSELENEISRCGVQDIVHLTGRLSEEELPKAYAAADCFILPTRALECFGLIVLEAFACQTPVLATNVAAIPELAMVQGREWLFSANDAQALSNKMDQFLDGTLRCTANLRQYAENFEISTIQELWEQSVLSV